MDQETPETEDLTPEQEADRKTHFTKTAAETNGELLEIDSYYEPHSAPPTPHFHPSQHEHFEVLEGSLTVNVDGEKRVYSAGESFEIPPGTIHSMWNAGDEEARVSWQIRPALKSQQFFETVWGLARDDKPITSNLMQAAIILRHYRDEFRLTRPSPLVQTLAFGFYALLGRWMGYKPSYGRYSNPQPPGSE
jgi:quercetin dioxygenase-like cupin family protein